MSKYNKNEALPIEEFIYSTVDPILGTFLYEKLCITPNMVTTITLLLTVVIGWCLFNNKYYIACGLILIRQLLDSLDGFIARKYNLKSKFGSLYDMVSDFINEIVIMAVIFYKFNYTGLLFALMNIYIGYVTEKRNKCIQRKDECSDPYKRNIVLKYTNRLSFFEAKIFMCLLIIIIYLKKSP